VSYQKQWNQYEDDGKLKSFMDGRRFQYDIQRLGLGF